jgi:hypothetical protein
MALSFDNCLIPQGGDPNSMYGTCCCDISCIVTADADITIDVFDAAFENSLFSITAKIYINDVLQTLPLFLNSGDSIEIRLSICASEPGDNDVLKLNFSFAEGGSEAFYFDFDAIDLSSTIDVSAFNFGNVNIGSTKTLGFQLTNPTICCYEYSISTSCGDMVIVPETSDLLCGGDKQSNFKIDWTPMATGDLNCSFFLMNECQSLELPATGRGVEPSPGGGGNPVSGKRTVVDSPTSDCRLANPQPGFAAKMKSSINQISRATSPKGGPGRGTNFKK